MTQPSTTSGNGDRAEKLRALADGLAATIRLSRVMAEARRTVDLTGLKAASACSARRRSICRPSKGPGNGSVPSPALLAEIDALAPRRSPAASGPPQSLIRPVFAPS